ncbi:MAG: SprB repeat-containing protein, partial [Bacteroidota bacterium]
MKWLHLLHFTVLFYGFLQQQLQAQTCQPDPALTVENTPSGLYPSPFHPQSNPNGGITEIAYNGKPYEFVFTLVLGDTLTTPNGTFTNDLEITLNEVNGLPEGLEAVTRPGSGRVVENTTGCLIIRGTPNDAPGEYEITLKGRFRTGSGLNINVTFPDDTNLPGQRYILRLEDGCPTDPCDGYEVSLANLQHESCRLSCDGSIEANIIGGTAPYTYNWTSSAAGTNGPIASDLCVGNYALTVTDANGCTDNILGRVEAGAGSFTLTTSSSDADCSGGNGTANVMVVGGSAPFSYLWSNNETTASLANLSAGTYTVTVEDATGCTMTETVTLGAGAGILATVEGNDISCHGANDGSATVTATGMGLSYTWSGSAASNTGTSANNLSAGNYTVTISDAGSCSTTVDFTITEPDELMLDMTKVDATCTLGSASVAHRGGTAPFSYNWSNQAQTRTISDLNAGTYMVTVTDANNCNEIASVTINGGGTPLQATITVNTQVSCNGGADGSATVSATGGAGSYTYQWSNSSTTSATATDLLAGVNIVTVTDGAACSTTAMVTLNEAGAIEIDVSTTPIGGCNGQADGGVSLIVTGGTSPYTYNWNNGLSNAATHTGLAAGTYRVTVTDADNCTNTASAMVTQQGDLVVEVMTTGIDCPGDATGTAAVRATGGATPYEYRWSDGNSFSQQRNDLTGGTHFVTVMDRNGCTGQATVLIPSPETLRANAMATDEIGIDDGTVSADPSGGTRPYTYRWNHQNAITRTISNLAPGAYTVTVTDRNGCTTSETVTVSTSGCAGRVQVEVFTTIIECNNADNAVARADVTGGRIPYQYNWSFTDSRRDSINDIGGGEYSVTVTDANNCPATASFTIDNPPALTIDLIEEQGTSCVGMSDGLIEVQAGGGTPPLHYDWGQNVNATRRTNLASGNYTVTVTDANGCTITETYTVDAAANLAVGVTNVRDVTCASMRDGMARVVAAGGTEPYTYLWSDDVRTQLRTDLGEGIYLVTITDGNGCTAVSDEIVIETPTAFEFSVSAQSNLSCNSINNGSVTLSTQGATGEVSYSWSNGLTVESTDTLSAGIYSITATDENGCPEELEVEITTPELLEVSVSATAQSAAGVADGTVSAFVSGGTAPYTYLWDTPNNDQTAQVNNLLPDTYNIVITDSNACTATASVTVDGDACALLATVTATDVLCSGTATGTASVEVQGADETQLSYRWSNDADEATVTQLAAGTYTVTVTQGTDCSTSAEVTINEPPTLNAAIVATGNVTCGNINNGFVEVAASGGTGAYSFAWSDGNTTARIENIAADDYNLIVSDANNCTTEVFVQIEAEEGLNIEAEVEQLSCFGENDASIQVIPSGGTIPYVYAWSDSNVNNAERSNLSAGEYMLTVSDDDGCESELVITVTEPSQLVADITTTTPAVCEDGNTGQVSVSTSGGVAPYRYNWSNGGTTTSAEGLGAGTHRVTVTDGQGCTQIATVDIETASAMDLNISFTNASNAGTDGSAVVGVSGGTPSYTYRWTNSTGTSVGTAANLDNVSAGNYTVVVTDANNCTASQTVVIEEEGCTGFDLTLDIVQPSCDGTSMGSITARVQNATGEVRYQWSNQSEEASITDLDEGTYNLTVIDDNNCSITASATIAISAGIEVEVATMEAMSCQ